MSGNRTASGSIQVPPEFRLFSQRVLVALDTDQGHVYAAASGWDRVYLLWTFRNFRSLPQNVLSPRQQQLIGSLYREASNSPHEVHDAVVVGTVEDFKPSSLSTLPFSVKARKRVASEKRPPDVSIVDSPAFFARFAGNRMTLKVGTAAVVLAIATLAWHQLGAQPVVGSTSTQTVAAARRTDELASAVMATDGTKKDPGPGVVEPASNPVVAISLGSTTGNPEAAATNVGTASPAIQWSAALPARSVPQSIAAPQAHRLATASQPNDGAGSLHHPVAASPKIYEASADQPRMQISGGPRKLVYPVCPETQARGEVSLQAVVGYDGAVSRVRVLTGDRALAAAAVEAVRQWRYEPFSGAAPRLERETNITISFISNEVLAVSFPNSTPLSR